MSSFFSNVIYNYVLKITSEKLGKLTKCQNSICFLNKKDFRSLNWSYSKVQYE